MKSEESRGAGNVGETKFQSITLGKRAKKRTNVEQKHASSCKYVEIEADQGIETKDMIIE